MCYTEKAEQARNAQQRPGIKTTINVTCVVVGDDCRSYDVLPQYHDALAHRETEPESQDLGSS